MNRRYEVLGVLGSGGMATVWRARDHELNRIVAIKRPHPAPAGSSMHERFKREARAAATVSHPNLVTVHDVGTDDDGPYLVMEFVDAGSLAEIEWNRSKAVRIGIDIADALTALHAAGIVHRDVKPANILVPDSGAMLTDFGIARSGGDAALTQEGTTFATPAYAAPEVIARGDHSPASDVYSLAAVLREMILGRRVAPTTDTQVLIADDLWAPVIDRAMAERPEDRPSASVFADELRLLPAAASLPPTSALGVERSEAFDRSDVLPPTDDHTVPRALAVERDRPWLPAFAVALAAVVVLAALVLAVRRSTGDSEPDADAPPSIVAEDTEPPTATNTATSVPATTPVAAPPAAEPDDTTATATAPITTAPITTAPITTTPTTVAEQPSDVGELRDDFAAFVSSIPDDVLKSKQGERLVDDVDKAIEAARENDIDKAAREIDGALQRIDKQFDDAATADRAIDHVRRLADQLGVDIDDGR